MQERTACAESVIFTRITPGGRGDGAHFSVGLKLVGMLGLSVCVKRAIFTRVTPGGSGTWCPIYRGGKTGRDARTVGVSRVSPWGQAKSCPVFCGTRLFRPVRSAGLLLSGISTRCYSGPASPRLPAGAGDRGRAPGRSSQGPPGRAPTVALRSGQVPAGLMAPSVWGGGGPTARVARLELRGGGGGGSAVPQLAAVAQCRAPFR